MRVVLFFIFFLLSVVFSAQGQPNALLIKDKHSTRFKIIPQDQKIKLWMKDYPHLAMRGRLQEVKDSVIVVDGTQFPIANIKKIGKSRPGLTVLKVAGGVGVGYFLVWTGLGTILILQGGEAFLGLGVYAVAVGTVGSGICSIPLFISDKKYKSEQWEILPYYLPKK